MSDLIGGGAAGKEPLSVCNRLNAEVCETDTRRERRRLGDTRLLSDGCEAVPLVGLPAFQDTEWGQGGNRALVSESGGGKQRAIFRLLALAPAADDEHFQVQ